MTLALLKYIGIGGSLAFAAAVQPGPLQAFLFSRATSIGWKKTLPASFSPLISDGPIALIALLVLGRLSPGIQSILRLAGGILLIYLAFSAYRKWRNHKGRTVEENVKTPKTLLEAALINLLNPNPYLGWTLILGPVVVSAWHEAPGLGIAVVAAFYATMTVTLSILIVLFGTARFLSDGIQRSLVLVSAMILCGLGIYQLILGIRYLS